MKLHFESDLPKVQQMLEEMARKVTPAATATAINRTATHVIKLTRQEVALETGIEQKHFTRRIKVQKGQGATARRPWALVWLGVWEIPVSKLTPKPRQLKSTGQAKYKTLPWQPIDPQAFVARGRKGVSAFARKGQPRLPIKQKTVDIGPVARRRMWMNLGGPARQFYEKTFFQQMDGRVINEFRKRGMVAR